MKKKPEHLWNEHDIQNGAVKALRKLGFTCVCTSNARRTSNSRGTADVFVCVWGNIWLGLEFKQPGGKLTKEQEELSTKIYIAYSVNDAVNMCLAHKRSFSSLFP